ncbi:hypothetical protein, partial [Aquitalea magnusonii]|uniref:hypothetical protein n=1 Tax=Aquitalea magnusonii TaxID=332411 RepID=UPI00195638DC
MPFDMQFQFAHASFLSVYFQQAQQQRIAGQYLADAVGAARRSSCPSICSFSSLMHRSFPF